MEIKAKSSRQTAADEDQGEKENKANDLLKKKINNFLISYFNYLVLVVAIIIFTIGVILFVYPQYQKIVKTNQAAKENLQVEYEKKLNYFNSITKLKQSYQLIDAADQKKIGAMLPADKDVGRIISEIEAIALKNGVILNSVKVNFEDGKSATKLLTDLGGKKEEPPAGIFNKLPAGVSRLKIEINLSSANYQVLKNIIKTLENNLRLFDLSKIDYNAGENKASLIAYSYYLAN